MTDEGYNGWKNYETWVMALWIDNDAGSYEWSREQAREAFEQGADEMPANSGPEDDAAKLREVAYTLAQTLRDEYETAMYDWMPEPASVFSDLLLSGFGEIDWHEIASNYLSEIAVDA